MGTLINPKLQPRNIEFGKLKIMVMSQVGLGKTTFAADGGAYFAACEQGQSALDVYKTDIKDWPTFRNLVKEFTEGGHGFKTLAIDCIDSAIKMYTDFECDRSKSTSLQEVAGGYGKGTSRLDLEVTRVLKKLCDMPYGLIILSHVKEKEVKKGEVTVHMTVPAIPDDIGNFIAGQMDVVLFGAYDRITKKRKLYTTPESFSWAKDRTGFLPESFDFRFADFEREFKAGRKRWLNANPEIKARLLAEQETKKKLETPEEAPKINMEDSTNE